MEENQNQQEQNLSEEERRIKAFAVEDGVSEDVARKHLAEKEIEELTGRTAKEMREVGKNSLKAAEGLDKPDAQQAAAAMSNLQGSAVSDMLDKTQDDRVATKMVDAGFGSEFTSTGKEGLKNAAGKVIEATHEVGDGSKMQELLAEGVMYGQGKTLEELRNMTPEDLKKFVDEAKSKQNQNPTDEKKQETQQRDQQEETSEGDKGLARAIVDKLVNGH